MVTVKNNIVKKPFSVGIIVLIVTTTLIVIIGCLFLLYKTVSLKNVLTLLFIITQSLKQHK